MNYNQNRTILGGNTNTIVTSVVNLGVSSLSSIVSYGLSTVAAGAINPGVSSLSSIVSYGLSTIVGSGGGSGSFNGDTISTLNVLCNLNIGGANNTTKIVIGSVREFGIDGLSLFINDTNATSNIIQQNYNSIGWLDVAFNGSMWVAVGVGDGSNASSVVAYSYNGANWSNGNLAAFDFNNYYYQIPGLFSVEYGNNLWTAVGWNNGSNIFFSLDGINWTPNSNFPEFFPPLYSVAYNSNTNLWVYGAQEIFGPNVTLLTTNDPTGSNIEVAATGGFDTVCIYAVTNPATNSWIAVGQDILNNNCIQYSLDGSNWYPAYNLTTGSNSFFNSGFGIGFGAAYGNGRWLVTGIDNNGNSIYSSADGSNFSLIANLSNVMIDIQYGGGSTFYATAFNITNIFEGSLNSDLYLLKSEDNGYTWASNILYYNNSNYNSPFSRLAIQLGTNNAASVTIADGSITTTSNITVGGSVQIAQKLSVVGDVLATGITALSNTGIVGSNWVYTSKNVVELIAFASANNASNTGVYFYNQSNRIITPTGNSNYAYDVCYNGSLWVAVGPNSGVIQTSTDGSNWSNVTMTTDNFTGYGVTYANNLWVVAGQNYSAGTGVFTSSDGNIWTPNYNFYADTDNYYFKPVYNSTDDYWLIPRLLYSGNNRVYSIYYSVDPTSSINSHVGNFDSSCRGLCWNGSNLWVAVGTSINGAENIQYSSDGSNWNTASNLTNSTKNFFNSDIGGYGVAYGTDVGLWLVVGQVAYGQPYNTIYSSTDGSNFSLINSNYNGLWDIKYLGGSNWIASYNTLTEVALTNGLIWSSDNGSNWSNIPLTDYPFLIHVYNPIQTTSNLVGISSNLLALDVYGNTNLHGNLTVSGNVSMSNILTTNLDTINLVAYSITTLDLITNSIINNNITTSDILANDIGTSNLTASNITTNYIAATNIGATNLAATNLVAGDLLATNLVANDIGTSNLVASNITTTDLAATNQITSSNLITNLLNFIDQIQGSNQLLYVAQNLLYFNNFIIAGSRQFQPQFITFTPPSTVPIVTTISFSQGYYGNPTTVTFTGEIVNNGGQTITEMGVVYAPNSAPTLLDSFYIYTPTIQSGTFSIGPSIYFGTGPIYARTYAINSIGPSYGSDIYMNISICLAKGTLIQLFNGLLKTIESVLYSDDLLVWDFDERRFTSAKPLWMKKAETTTRYNLLTFSDGTTLKTINQHRIFNKEKGAFTYPMTDATPVGTTTFNSKGEEITLLSKEVIIELTEYYNIITHYHMNLFANTILTSCRYNNIYPIVDMTFVKDERSPTAVPAAAAPYATGLRLAEQIIPIRETLEYIANLERLKA